MSVIEKVNIDLLVPLVIVFAFLRFKKYYCLPQKLLRGLRFFISNTTLSQKHLRAPVSASAQKDQSIIDKKLQQNNLSMMELDGSVRKGSILSDVLLYDMYEVLVYLSFCSLVVHTFSTVLHCFSPESKYSIWGTIFVALSVILPFRALLRILIMTGFQAFESRVAVVVSLISFVTTAALLNAPIDLLGLSLDNALTTTAIHCNALLLQLSSTAVQPTVPVMTAVVKVIISSIVALTALGMVIPAMRFSQSFNTLLFGAKYEKASSAVQLILILDHLMPVLVATVMIPQGLGLGTLSAKADGYWLAAQLTAILMMVSLRLFCMKKHIQTFLDAVVRTISVEIAVSGDVDAMSSGIQEKVYARFNYIPAAAVQYISVPLCAFGLALLVHKAAPAGTGVCVDFRGALGMDTAQIISASTAALAYDATSSALAMSSRGEPTFMSGVYMFLMSAGEGGRSPSEELRAFLSRLASSLHLLPVGVFVTLGRAALCVHCLLWFIISTCSIAYWYVSPMSLKKATGGLLLKKEK